jgi:hypothetical protein
VSSGLPTDVLATLARRAAPLYGRDAALGGYWYWVWVASSVNGEARTPTGSRDTTIEREKDSTVPSIGKGATTTRGRDVPRVAAGWQRDPRRSGLISLIRSSRFRLNDAAGVDRGRLRAGNHNPRVGDSSPSSATG